MILQALSAHYDRLAEDTTSGIALSGFSTEKIRYALVVSKSGKLQQVLDLQQVQGKRKIPRMLAVPQGPKRSSNIASTFLWGNTAYVLGASDKDNTERTADCHAAFKQLHSDLLGECNDDAANAILAFLSSWDPANAPGLEDWESMLKSNLVFQMEGDLHFVHEKSELKRVWQRSLESAEEGRRGMCLVSGRIAPIARLHAPIKGVIGAQSSGAALVSFNLDAFESYGKTQNYNAPVSESIASSYTKALNHLLSTEHNRIRIGDTTAVFWTERDTPVERFFGFVMDPRDTSADDQELQVYLQSVRDGKLPRDIDRDIRFYVLGLSPNAARISVRFWHVSTTEEISRRIGQHFNDLKMIKSYESDPEFPGMWTLLRETTNRKSKDGPPPLLAGAVMQAILNGSLYPQTLLSLVIGRIRADQTINYMRAAIIKAVLARKHRILNTGMEIPMALNKENNDPAYLLGRLFAVLEKAQRDAIGKTNATIKDRFYGSASATPRAVFPQLLRLSQHHMAKDEYGYVKDKQVGEILNGLDEFPAHLSLDSQGLFAIGYYHQRQDFYSKKNDSESKN